MGGDEIVAKWFGDVYGNNVATSSTIQRFSAVSLRFRTVILHNKDPVNKPYVGKYISDGTEFLNKAFLIPVLGIAQLEFIDLYELGYGTPVASVGISITGINEY